MSHHQNSHSSWSLSFSIISEEVVGHYECKIWGLPLSLGSYISSFLTDKTTHQNGRPVIRSYTHVGLILMSLGISTYYVANPISRQCIDIPQPPPIVNDFTPSGLATRIENDVVLGYKVVLIPTTNLDVLRLLIYSSETGLWSFKTLKSQSNLPLYYLDCYHPISLNGKLYWIGHNRDYGEVVLSHDFYATGTESDRYQVIFFPDVGTKPNFQKFCTIYVWCKIHKCLASTNLHKDKFGLHNNLERSSNYRTSISDGDWNMIEDVYKWKPTEVSMFVLPRWLYQIPSSPS